MILIGEHGFAWTPEAEKLPAVAPLIKQWGATAMHYLLRFGHPHSPHAEILDLQERNDSVVAELRSDKLGSKQKNLVTYGHNLYQSPEYSGAMDALLNHGCLPDWRIRQGYLEEISQINRLQKQINYTPTDPDKFKKQVDAAKALDARKAALIKDLNEVEADLQKLQRRSGKITLNEIWMTV
jgi:hypothetical protein